MRMQLPIARAVNPRGGPRLGRVARWACAMALICLPSGLPVRHVAAAPVAATPATAPATRPTTLPATYPAAEVESLIGRLASPDWRARGEAEARLIEFGDAIEARLRKLLADTSDSEVRTRAELILQHVDALRRLGPTRVTLRVRGATPRAALESLGRQAHVSVGALREPMWSQRKWPAIDVDLVDKPFWVAMRTVCGAAGLRALFLATDEGVGRVVVLPDESGEMRRPASFSGSFMVIATQLSRVMALPLPGEPPLATGELEFQCGFFTDPKWRIIEHPDTAEVQRVLDHAGRELPLPEPMRLQGYKAETPIWLMRCRLPAVPLDAGRIARVRGQFRITLLDQADPIEIGDVMAARNVERKAGGQLLHLQEVVREEGLYRVRLTIVRSGLSPQEWRAVREAEAIRLLDAAGRALVRNSYEPPAEEGDRVVHEVRFNVNTNRSAGPGPPAKLVCQIPLEPRALTVPFELNDLEVEK